MTVGSIGTNYIRGDRAVLPAVYTPAARAENILREQAIIFQNVITEAYSGGWDAVGKTHVGVNGVDYTQVTSADKTESTFTTLTATGRTFMNEDFPDQVTTPFTQPLDPAKFYAAVVHVSAISGSTGSNNFVISVGFGSGTVQGTLVLGYNVLTFKPSGAYAQVRAGVGTQGAGPIGSITIKEVWFTEIDSLIANVPDYVPPRSTAYMKYSAGNTVSGTVLTMAQGSLVGNPPRGLSGAGVGDSLSSDFYEWPALIPGLHEGRSIRMMSQASRTMEEMSLMIDLLVDKDGQSASLADFDYFVCQAGLNDLIAHKTAEQIEGYLDTILAALPVGVKIIVCNITPFGQYADWTTSLEAERTAFNALLKVKSGISVADIAAVLQQPQIAATLPDPNIASGDGDYSNFKDTPTGSGSPGSFIAGDGLHPNSMGQAAMAVVINAAVDAAFSSSNTGVYLEIAPGLNVPL